MLSWILTTHVALHLAVLHDVHHERQDDCAVTGVVGSRSMCLDIDAEEDVDVDRFAMWSM